jgi:type IV pilus assembly protein PilM
MSPRNASVSSWLASPPPAVALDINATRVIGVALGEHGGEHVVTAHAIEPITDAVAAPALNAPNIHDEKALADAIREVLQRLGYRTRRVALVLPDTVAKVSLIRFDKVPARAQDLDQLIRWQMRKAAPFRIEDAQFAWQPALPVAGGGREYLVTVARRDIIRGYEQACMAAGVHAGLVDIASFNHINAVIAGAPPAGDWLLVNVAADYATLALVRDGVIIFFRNRTAAGEGDLADLVHQTAMYHEDRLGGGGFSRIVLAGISVMGAGEAERLRRTLGERIAASVELIDFRSAAGMRDRITVDPELVDQLAPSVGILLRDRPVRRSARAASTEVA